jgi:hypothetical protein
MVGMAGLMVGYEPSRVGEEMRRLFLTRSEKSGSDSGLRMEVRQGTDAE